MAFMGGRDFKFVAPSPRVRKLIQMVTLASMATRSSGQEYAVSSSGGVCSYSDMSAHLWVDAWVSWFRGVMFGIMLAVFIMIICGIVYKCRTTTTPTETATTIVPAPREIVPATREIVPAGNPRPITKFKMVRDVNTMSQTTYVTRKRHDAVNGYQGDAFTGTPYIL